jgi:hypothetical protein
VQSQLSHGGPGMVQYLLDQVRADLPDIIRDMFGNYFVQALFRVANDLQRETVLCAMESSLLDIACDRNGTYALQSIVDQVGRVGGCRGRRASAPSTLWLHSCCGPVSCGGGG